MIQSRFKQTVKADGSSQQPSLWNQAVVAGEKCVQDLISDLQMFVETPLIWRASNENMVHHIMKTTVEIADDLFERIQRVAREEKTTFRSLIEQGLRLVLKQKQGTSRNWNWKPFVVHGRGLSNEFKNAPWEKIRDEIYKGRGS